MIERGMKRLSMRALIIDDELTHSSAEGQLHPLRQPSSNLSVCSGCRQGADARIVVADLLVW